MLSPCQQITGRIITISQKERELKLEMEKKPVNIELLEKIQEELIALTGKMDGELRFWQLWPEQMKKSVVLEIGGKSTEQLVKMLRERNFKFDSRVVEMLQSLDFTVLQEPEQIRLIKLKVCDLGFVDDTTIDELYTRAKELGLELCPAEVGPHQRLNDLNQPQYDDYFIAMEPIKDINRWLPPTIFRLTRNGTNGTWLGYDSLWTSRQSINRVFVFRLPSLGSRSQ